MTDASRQSVLFVDDEPDVLRALERMLHDEPFDVRVCEDPQQALDLVTADPPTVVVADFYMPGMLGPAFLHEVREIDEKIVRIVMTGKPDVTAVLDAVNEGAVYRFILKPWDEDELRMTLLQAFEHHRLLSERRELLTQLDRQRRTIRDLEAGHPRPPELPGNDEGGAFVSGDAHRPPRRTGR